MYFQVLNPLDAICNQPRTDAVCINQLKNAKPVDEGILQERPDVKIFLPFRFLFYRPEELFQPHQYNRFLGQFYLFIYLDNIYIIIDYRYVAKFLVNSVSRQIPNGQSFLQYSFYTKEL